ncbi:histidine phosphatase superfamily [Staphylotrichum tortipilum]|uniref:Histidine phosphatase superfamily n=1 Tax=Staphylotrichum tortipilum TaxID=2831512 RepID=A0AAN6RPZ5_9PEZI|nr:histidine phosphatase superfamily [Staphylotrichum longicolle]
MSDQDALTPRVFLVRHGNLKEINTGFKVYITGRRIGPSEAQVSSTAATLVGAGKLLDPSRLAHIFISPRRRARRTFELLLLSPSFGAADWKEKITYTEDIAEWDYGDYEGLKVGEIRKLRKERGLDQEMEWDIWRDGCEGGESMQRVSDRLDRLVSQIREIQRPHMNRGGAADVLLVAHGLILRCFLKRWLDFSVDFPLQMMLAPGAIAVLSYKNNNIEEPAFHLGITLPLLGERGKR